MENFNFDIIASSSPILRFQLTIPEDVSDWTTTLYVKDKTTGNVVLQVNGALADPAQVPNAAALGVFDITLSAVQTSGLNSLRIGTSKQYAYAFWRTNVGFEDPLVSGVISVQQVAPH